VKQYSPSQMFGRQLRNAREHQGFTRHQLAERMTPDGYSVINQLWTIERIECGTRRVMLEEVEDFARALVMPVDALMAPLGWGEKEASECREDLMRSPPKDFG